MEKICKNCLLFCPDRGLCGVTIIQEGEYMNLKVLPEDPCFFEEEYFDPISGKKETFNEIKELRLFEKDGKVQIEYPAE